MADLPIKIQEHAKFAAFLLDIVQLKQLGLDPTAVDTLTLDSDRFVCMREKVDGDEIFAIVFDPATPQNPIRIPVKSADAAVVSLDGKLLAVRDGKTLRIIELATKRTENSHDMSEEVVFCRWISNDTVAIVTDGAVYHWNAKGADASVPPQKMFSRNSALADTRIAGYHTDDTLKWLLLIGVLQPNVAGKMQLYSVDDDTFTEPQLDGDAATFFRFVTNENVETPVALAYIERPRLTSVTSEPKLGKLHVRQVKTRAEAANQPSPEKFVFIEFPPDTGHEDYPLAIHPGEKYGVLFVITHRGFVLLYDVDSLACICVHRFTTESVCATAACTSTSGFVCADKSGKILSVSIDEARIVPYMIRHHPELALTFAARSTDLGGADELFVKRFNELFQDGRYPEAAQVAACTPNSSNLLRTPQTIQRFRSAVSSQQQQKPLLQQYFDILLEHGMLNKHESLELCRHTLLQNRDNKKKVEKWLEDGKLECSEELGNLLKQYDAALAESVFKQAGISPPKAVAEQQQHLGFVDTNENSVFSVEDPDEFESKPDGRLSADNKTTPAPMPTVTFSSALPTSSSNANASQMLFGGGANKPAVSFLPFGSTLPGVAAATNTGLFGATANNTLSGHTPQGANTSSSMPTYLPFGTTSTSAPAASFAPFGSADGGGAAGGSGGGFSFLNWNKTASAAPATTGSGKPLSSSINTDRNRQPLGASASSSFAVTNSSNRFPNNINNLKRKSSAGAVVPILASKPSSNNNNNNKHQRIFGSGSSGASVKQPNSASVPNGGTSSSGERSLFNERAKLYRFDTPSTGGAGAWKERGSGNIQLILNTNTSKVSCVMHCDQTHKLCCNHLIQATMRCEAVKPLVSDEKFTQLMWYANDYSSSALATTNDGAEASNAAPRLELRNELFRVRFKTPEQAQRFQRVFQQAVSDAAAAAPSPTIAAAHSADVIPPTPSPTTSQSHTDSAETTLSSQIPVEPKANDDSKSSRNSSGNSSSSSVGSLKRTTSVADASPSSPLRQTSSAQSDGSSTNRSPEQQHPWRKGQVKGDISSDEKSKSGVEECVTPDEIVAPSPLSQQQPPAKRLCASSDD